MSEWISVKDRLPEIELGREFYGLATDGRFVFPAKFWLRRWLPEKDHKDFAWESQHPIISGDVSRYVTHWMPIPDPPRG